MSLEAQWLRCHTSNTAGPSSTNCWYRGNRIPHAEQYCWKIKKKSIGHECMDLFLDSQFYSVLLYVCPYASIIHFDYITFVSSFETKKSESSNFVLFRDFATCNFIQIWESAYIFLQKSPLEFCSSLLWLYRSLRTSIDVLTMLSLPTHDYCLAIYLSCWGIFLLFLFFWQFLLWKGVGLLSNAFSVNISIEMMIRFPIHSSKVVYYIDWFSYVEKTYLRNPGIFLFFDILFSFWSIKTHSPGAFWGKVHGR